MTVPGSSLASNQTSPEVRSWSCTINDKVDISQSVRKNRTLSGQSSRLLSWFDLVNFYVERFVIFWLKKGSSDRDNDWAPRSVVKVGRKSWSDLTHTLINRLKNRNFFQKHKLVSSISIWDQQQKYQSKCSHYQGKLNHIWEKYERFYKFVFV